jgi:hypothetical protein
MTLLVEGAVPAASEMDADVEVDVDVDADADASGEEGPAASPRTVSTLLDPSAYDRWARARGARTRSAANDLVKDAIVGGCG